MQAQLSANGHVQHVSASNPTACCPSLTANRPPSMKVLIRCSAAICECLLEVAGRNGPPALRWLVRAACCVTSSDLIRLPGMRILTSPNSTNTSSDPTRPQRPQEWWRVPCQVTERILISGDLDTFNPERGVAQLEEWVALGVTDIIDVRDEWSDEGFVADAAPHIHYHYFGTDDGDNGQPDEWFKAGVEAALEALSDPSRKLMVHCHMGVNRGPSMAFAILLATGVSPVEALALIRASRPISGIIYAPDALMWHHRRSGTTEAVAALEHQLVRDWMNANPVDVRWIVSRIHQVGYSS